MAADRVADNRVGGEDAAFIDWVVAEAALAKSDGCTAVSEWNQWCCFEHDLACRYGKDPRVAFKLWQYGLADPWTCAPSLSRRDADKRFAACNWRRSKGLIDRTRTGVRYIGVRLGALWPF